MSISTAVLKDNAGNVIGGVETFRDLSVVEALRKELAGRHSFLDEIGDVSPALQVRLLRVLQDKVYEPFGSVGAEHADVRIVAATNKNMELMVKKGDFREDLYYRINVAKLSLPPLRGRKYDIPLLIDHFTIKLNNSKGLKMPIYEYRCKDCGATSEFLLGVGKDEKIFCHTCESLNIERIMSAASFVRMANARPAGDTCCGREERCEAPPCSSGGTCSRH